MKRPVLWVLAFYIPGILMGRYVWEIGAVLFLVAALFASGFFLLRRLGKGGPALVLLFAAGYFLCGNALDTGTEALNRAAGDDTKIIAEGVLYDVSRTQSGYQLTTLKAREIRNAGTGEALFSSQKDGALKLMVISGITDTPLDSRVTFTGELDIFAGKENPGGFDEAVYMKARGFSYEAYTEDIAFSPGERSARYYLLSFREAVSEVFDRSLPANESAVMKAVIIGDRSSLPEEIKELYREGGISHILAISGLHISIFSAALYILVRKVLGAGRRAAALSNIGILVLYAIFTGLGVSVVRSVIMSSIFLMGGVLGRERDGANSLGVAALLILLYNPLYLWDPGFLLSFTAVAGVLAGAYYLRDCHRLHWIIKEYVGITLAASLTGYPVVAYFFSSVPLAGVMVNVLAIPAASVLVASGLLSGLFGLISPGLGVFFAGPAYIVLNFYELAARAFTWNGALLVNTGAPSALTAVLYYVLLGYIFFVRTRFRKGIFAALLAALFVSMNANKLLFKRDAITFLSVGNGDAAVIETYKGNVFLVDGGGWSYREMGDNTGMNVLLPFLRFHGRDSVDAIFLSHLDSDHILGAIELLYCVPVGRVYLPDCEVRDREAYPLLIKALAENNVPLYKLRAGETLDIGGDAVLQCIYPTEGNIIKDSNRGSMVLRYARGETTVLFTGDLDMAGEEDLLGTGALVASDVLKVGHHGSKTSTSPEFVEAVSADAAVISSGAGNVYGHPHGDTLRRLAGAEIFNTAEDGAVMLKTNGESIKITSMTGEIQYEKTESKHQE